MSALKQVIEIAGRSHPDISNEHMEDIIAIVLKANSELAELLTKHNRVLYEAVKILWLDDNSDYGNSLWKIVDLLGGQEITQMLEDDASEGEAVSAWLETHKENENER